MNYNIKKKLFKKVTTGPQGLGTDSTLWFLLRHVSRGYLRHPMQREKVRVLLDSLGL